jgi:alpha-ketoglutarate-dependent taurine dioxygenase
MARHRSDRPIEPESREERMTTEVDYATTTTELIITRTAGHLGAEIGGVDLGAELSDETIAEVRQALLTHKVLFFRDQQVSHGQHVALARRFGDLTRRSAPHAGLSPDGYPEILTIDPELEDDRYGVDFEEKYRQKWLSYQGGWHSDLTPAVNPPAMSILRAEIVPPFAGDTQWTNLVAAYQGLSPSLRDFVDTLKAEHCFFAGCQMLQHDVDDRAVIQKNVDYPLVSVHPVVRVHPETGERALFVNPASTNRILGLSPTESRHILDLLFEQIIRPEYTVRFRWYAGSIAFWDNRSTAHLAAVDLNHLKVSRRMHRVTILGDRPVGPDGFVSEVVAGEPFYPLP